MATRHLLKSWPEFYRAIATGERTHELRRDDRRYRVGDILVLEEYDPQAEQYSGESCEVLITSITSAETPCAVSDVALASGYCILSVRLIVRS